MATIDSDPQLPIDDAEESSEGMNFPAHARTFHTVLRVFRWFLAHVFILLISVYCLDIANQPGIGVFGILCAIALLIYALTHRRNAAGPEQRADHVGQTRPAG